MIQRHNYGTDCWWCGAVADSQEHKYKKADITRLFGKGSYQGTGAVSRIIEGQERNVQGPKSRELVFGPTLCQKCNNETSQPFDLAYDKFIAYLDSNDSMVVSDRQIILSQVFGDSWFDDWQNLIRYIVKHIGCRLAEASVLIYPEYVSFLNGEGGLTGVELSFEIRADIVALESKLSSEGLDRGSVWLGDVQTNHHLPTDTYSHLRSHLGYRWFRICYEYDDSLVAVFNDSPNEVLRLDEDHSVDPETIRNDSP